MMLMKNEIIILILLVLVSFYLLQEWLISRSYTRIETSFDWDLQWKITTEKFPEVESWWNTYWCKK